MVKLDRSNVVTYLKGLGIFDNINWTEVEVAEVTEHTNVNFIFSVLLNSSLYKKIFLKQAFGYVKVSPDFPAPIERHYFEKLSIEYLQQYWKERIPQVIHYDKENNILVITDVGEGASLLANEIKNGRLHFDIGNDLGQMMGELHSPTYDKEDFPVRDKKENQKHIDFIFDFRLRGSREISPKETEELFQESKSVRTSIIYGDWASKNIFVAGNKVRLVDFENLVRFDPSFDIGYALAHWVLDISQENQPEMIKFFEDFEKAYSGMWKPAFVDDVKGILKRAARYTGGMMLHRLAGVKNTNRMEEYLGKEVPLIEIARSFLQGNFSSPSEAVKSVSL